MWLWWYELRGRVRGMWWPIRGLLCKHLGHKPHQMWSITTMSELGKKNPYYSRTRTITICDYCRDIIRECEGIE